MGALADQAALEPEGYGPSEEVEGPISTIATQCQSNFTKSLQILISERENKHDISVRKLEKRFLNWAAYLGVFAGPKGSLDYRLKRHPQYRDLFLLMLDMLNMNLLQMATADSSEPSSDESSDDEVDRRKVEIDGIHKSINELDRLAIHIRQTTTSCIDARVKAFASRKPAEVSSFETKSILAINGLYPEASESLRRHLSKVMTERSTKLLYWQSHDEKLRADRRRVKTPRDDSFQQRREELPLPAAGSQPQSSVTGRNRTVANLEPGRGFSVITSLLSETLASDPGSRLTIPLGEGKVLSPRRAGASTVLGSKAKFPSPPQFEEGEILKPCPYCRKAFREADFTDIVWWRCHVNEDLRPFTCISSSCLDSPSFANRSDWAAHMEADHGAFLWLGPSNQIGNGIHSPRSESPETSNHGPLAATCPLCCLPLYEPRHTQASTPLPSMSSASQTSSEPVTLTPEAKNDFEIGITGTKTVQFDVTKHDEAAERIARVVADSETKTAASTKNPVLNPTMKLMMNHIADHLQFLALLSPRLSLQKLTDGDIHAFSSSQALSDDQASGERSTLGDEFEPAEGDGVQESDEYASLSETSKAETIPDSAWPHDEWIELGVESVNREAESPDPLLQHSYQQQPIQGRSDQAYGGYSSLYQACVALRERLVHVPGFKLFLKLYDQTKPVYQLWNLFRTGYPLLVIYNSLQPPEPLRVDDHDGSNAKNSKLAILKFVQECIKELHVPPTKSFVITDLMGDDTFGFLRVIQCVTYVLDLAEQRALMLQHHHYTGDKSLSVTGGYRTTRSDSNTTQSSFTTETDLSVNANLPLPIHGNNPAGAGTSAQPGLPTLAANTPDPLTPHEALQGGDEQGQRGPADPSSSQRTRGHRTGPLSVRQREDARNRKENLTVCARCKWKNRVCDCGDEGITRCTTCSSGRSNACVCTSHHFLPLVDQGGATQFTEHHCIYTMVSYQSLKSYTISQIATDIADYISNGGTHIKLYRTRMHAQAECTFDLNACLSLFHHIDSEFAQFPMFRDVMDHVVPHQSIRSRLQTCMPSLDEDCFNLSNFKLDALIDDEEHPSSASFLFQLFINASVSSVGTQNQLSRLGAILFLILGRQIEFEIFSTLSKNLKQKIMDPSTIWGLSYLQQRLFMMRLAYRKCSQSATGEKTEVDSSRLWGLCQHLANVHSCKQEWVVTAMRPLHVPPTIFPQGFTNASFEAWMSDVNAEGGHLGNALQAASCAGHDTVVNLLLANGAHVNARGGFYGSALQAASYEGHHKVVKALLDNGADVNALGGEHGNALQAASVRGNEKVVQMLLDKGADINSSGGQYGNALQAASLSGNEKIVGLLLDMGADVNVSGGMYGNTLQAASIRGNEKVVQMLLAKGADINAMNGRYSNALEAASLQGNEKVVGMLLDKGADINSSGGQYGNALRAASIQGNRKVVELLLDMGANVNAPVGERGNALQAASIRGNESVVQMLLDKGADVNAKGGEYGSALQAASSGGHEKVVSMLLDKGADVNAKGGEYGSALQAALSGGHEKVVSMLLDKGADVNAKGGEYDNALQAALDGEHEKVVKMLFDEGGDVNTGGRTQYGATAKSPTSRLYSDVF